MNSKLMKEQRVRLHSLLLAMTVLPNGRYTSLVKTTVELLRNRIARLMELETSEPSEVDAVNDDSPAEQKVTLLGKTEDELLKEIKIIMIEIGQRLYAATLHNGVPGTEISRNFKMHHAFALQLTCQDIIGWIDGGIANPSVESLSKNMSAVKEEPKVPVPPAPQVTDTEEGTKTGPGNTTAPATGASEQGTTTAPPTGNDAKTGENEKLSSEEMTSATGKAEAPDANEGKTGKTEAPDTNTGTADKTEAPDANAGEKDIKVD